MQEHKRSLLYRALAPSRACYAIEQLGGQPSAALDEHVRGCRRCQAEVALLDQFEAAMPRAGELEDVQWIAYHMGRSPSTGERQPEESRWQRLVQWLAGSANLRLLAMAACLLVVLAAGLQFRRTAEPALSFAVSSGAEVVRSARLAVIAPVGDVAQAPEELLWEALPGAAAYEVRILAVDRSELWKARVAQPRAPLRRYARELLLPGKTVFWQVTAFDASGRKLAESALARLRLSLPGESE